MNKWIILDVDDVVLNFRQSLVESFRANGLDIPWESWTNYHHVKIYNLPDEQAFHQHLITAKVLEKADLEPGCHEALGAIKEHGYKIGLLTARGWHPEGYKITQDFVGQHGLPVDKIVVSSGHLAKKSDYLTQFDGVTHGYLDDSIHHVEDFRAKGINNSYLLDRPWNKHSLLARVYSLDEFSQKITRLD